MAARRTAWLASWLACLLAAGPALAAAPATGWLRYESQTFTIYSQLPAARTRLWVRDYERFIATVSAELGVDTSRLDPLTLVIFDDDDRFAAYGPRRGNVARAAATRGFFTRRDGLAIAGLSGEGDDARMRTLIFHEGVHWLLSADDRRWPAWLGEGLAEYFSTFQVRDGKAYWGRPHPGLEPDVRAPRPVPLAQLLGAARDDALFHSDRRSGMFYARAWATVHHLAGLHGARGLLERMRAVVDARPDGRSAAADVAHALGADVPALERAVDDYRIRAVFREAGGRDAVTPVTHLDVQLARAAPFTVQAALARLAQATGRDALAQQHAREAAAGGGGG